MPTDMIVKNDGTYLICGHDASDCVNRTTLCKKIYAVNNDGSIQSCVFKIGNTSDDICKNINAFFQLECGFYVMVVNSCDLYERYYKISVIDPTNCKIVTEHVFNDSVTQTVHYKNDRFYAYISNLTAIDIDIFEFVQVTANGT